jgi:hypothetical protein
VALGQGMAPKDIIWRAWAVCADSTCDPRPSVIGTQLWDYNHQHTLLGSGGEIVCEGGEHCGAYRGGSCTVSFQGDFNGWDMRNTLISALEAVANASQKPAFDQWACETFPACSDCDMVNCVSAARDATPVTSMPSFIALNNWHDGNQAVSLKMLLSCDVAPTPPMPNLVCIGTSIATTLFGLLLPTVSAVLGVFSAACTDVVG